MEVLKLEPLLEFLEPASNGTRVRLEPHRRTTGTFVYDIKIGSPGASSTSAPETLSDKSSSSPRDVRSPPIKRRQVHFSLQAEHTSGPTTQTTASHLQLETQANSSEQLRPDDSPFAIDSETGHICLGRPLIEADEGDWLLVVLANDSTGLRLHSLTLVVEVSFFKC